ncbi:TadE/TadG family type IV pilus assembly protein [Desulfoglaeba alkanexedens]|uniref:TadE/TadG family type IV pilus assembly protein n=1 Tax=Desulfoglaeba alkanexedens TaxID=361111 RepID=UPI0014770C1A|nr:TadE family protein [Desulfoglaeba alkanexedens]
MIKGTKVGNKAEKGAAAVEFAIILPILIMLLFGIFQFGIAFNNYIAITHAAREGARLAAVDPLNPDDLKEIIIQRAYPVPLKEGDITIRTPEGTEVGQPVEVEISYDITIEIPLVGSWSIPLTNKAVMRLENSGHE